MDGKLYTLLMGFRQMLIMGLGLIEVYLGMERSRPPKRKRIQSTGDDVV